jgi:monoterpene epsilon-lactone hydrolase
MPRCALTLLLLTYAVAISSVHAQNTPSNPDNTSFDANGTAHITRVVPIPNTVSPEAQQWLKEIEHESPQAKDLAEQRAGTDAWRKRDSAEALKRFPVKITETTIVGVRADVIEPLDTPAANKNKVLINLHGGGFITDSGSLIEGIPIANLAKIKVVSVYYRLAPENPFSAAVDDVVAVYKDLTFLVHKIDRPESPLRA